MSFTDNLISYNETIVRYLDHCDTNLFSALTCTCRRHLSVVKMILHVGRMEVHTTS